VNLEQQLRSLEQLVTASEAKLLELQRRLDAQGTLVVNLSELVVDLSNAVIRQDDTIKNMLKSIGILLDLEKARRDVASGPVPPPSKTGVSEVA